MAFNKIAVDIFKLVLQIILLIILEGLDPKEATKNISKQSGVGFARLWSKLPSKYK